MNYSMSRLFILDVTRMQTLSHSKKSVALETIDQISFLFS